MKRVQKSFRLVALNRVASGLKLFKILGHGCWPRNALTPERSPARASRSPAISIQILGNKVKGRIFFPSPVRDLVVIIFKWELFATFDELD